MPELEVVSQGALKGFVLVHPRWAGFQVRDYLMASASVESAGDPMGKTCKYRVQGIRHTIGTDLILLFNLEDTEVFIPKDQFPQLNDGTKSLVPDSGAKAAAFPADWAQGFGANYYCHHEMRTLSAFGLQDNWELQEDISVFQGETSIRVTSQEKLQAEIAKLIKEMQQENSNE